jgi:hypothetical protein
MTRFVTSHYRYKRPPRKRPKGRADRGAGRPDHLRQDAAQSARRGEGGASNSTPANDDRKPAIIAAKPPKPVPSPAPTARPSAIVTARRPGERYADVPEVSEEEHRRVGDLADAMMAEFKRVIAEKIRK